MAMVLNKKQKKFLFENHYVTAKTLDADVEIGWTSYFINYFEWKLENVEMVCGGREYDARLKIIGKRDIAYDILLFFTDNDYYELVNLS